MAKPKIEVTIEDAKLRRLIRATGGTVQGKVVADGVEYGAYQEFGTSKMAAQPFMRPAIEAVRGPFQKAMSQAWRSTREAQDVVDKTAFSVEQGAKQRAPVDTGALRSSIHVEDAEGFGG